MPFNTGAGSLATDLCQFKAEFYEMRFGDVTQPDEQGRDIITAQFVDHEFAISAAVHQMRCLQRFKVSAGEFDVDMCLRGNLFNRLGALRQEIQQFQPFRAGQRFANAGDLFVERCFRVCHSHILTNIRMSATGLKKTPRL